MHAKSRKALGLASGCAALGITLLICSPAAGQEDAAGTFRKAREYTVRVQTQITDAFVEDEAGSFSGAGFLVDAARGWIVTNAHVVGLSPSEVQVAFADEAFQPVRKVYVDLFTDVAVLALGAPTPGRAAARLADGTPPDVGEPVAVFGHPADMPFTGSRGIICGRTDQEGAALLQIDANIDHGNSGGPVISLRDGRIVGIATSGAGGDRADRFNFATPMPDVCRILALLRRGVQPCPPVLSFGLLVDRDARHTMRVGNTLDADRWPFQPGDRILRVARSGGPLQSLTDLVSALRASRETVPLVVERDGREVTVPVRPALYPPVTERRGVRIDGALIAPKVLADGDLIGFAQRLMVQSVEPGSRAEALSVGVGDVLWSVDGRQILELDSLAALVGARPSSEPLSLVLLRFPGQNGHLLGWHIRELPGEDVRMVGAVPELAARDPE
jgi:S1-C subfamily serine protease